MIGTNICFDPGTSNMFVFVQGKGVTVNEPTVVAYDAETQKINAIGRRAYEMSGKTPDGIDIVFPMKNASIADFQTMNNVLGYYIQKICGSRVLKPNLLISVPCEANTVDKRTALDLATASGAAKACVVESTLAAAVGAGIDMNSYKGTLVADIGAGTSDLAVIARGMICTSRSTNIAGGAFDDSIINYLRREKEIVVGKNTAESIKKEIGCTSFLEAELAVRAAGKDSITGLPKSVEINSAEVFMCIREQLELLTEEIRLLLEKTPPELTADIFKNGIVLTGGSALLTGIDKFIEYRLDIPTRVAEDPQTCVIRGMGKLLKAPVLLERNGCFYKTRQELGYEE